MGVVELELYYKHAPNTCYNFGELANQHYYDDTIFHRVIQDFMIQGGDPSGTGKGGESIFGGSFKDEITKELKHCGAGILSMANHGKDTNGSQFFITLAPTPWLDGKHTIFGRVSKGMEVVYQISMVETDNDKPKKDIKIIKAEAK